MKATEQLESTDVNTGPEKVGGDKESGADEPAKDKELAQDKSSATTPRSKPDHDTSAPGKVEEVGTGMRQAGVEDSVVNKELLQACPPAPSFFFVHFWLSSSSDLFSVSYFNSEQAFRFFDRNRVGYIRVCRNSPFPCYFIIHQGE